ncbi:hypothetical protein MTR67_022874 [Solanum verrucosum]|uniref:Uncharacterized protein n=1 Tax=Solanum verrucosum TaxID=315347 RepID=A0AAF0QSH8_SOLVR|nr:hypothetical protein MTR67_022874 [Solanum verrucosum]
MNVNSESPTLELIPIVNEFPEVFPNDLPGISPKREIDVGIDLLPDTQPISIPPYRMAPAELKELKEQLKVLLDKGGYYRRFVEGFSSIVSPLTTLTQKKAKFIWSEACEKSFQELKDRLTSAPVLTLPDETNGFVVYCDASRIELGCVLMQNGKFIAYASRWCRSPIGWFEVGEVALIGPQLGVVRFGKKGKLSPCYVGPYQILRRVGNVAYELDFPNELASVHPVFHVSMLKKCIRDPTSIVPLEGLGFRENLSYEVISIEILNRQVKKLSNKQVAFVKVLWRNHLVEGATWEAEADMMSRYPNFFPSTPTLA